MILLSVDKIIADPECQMRAAGSRAVIQEYAEALIGGATFPPVIVFRDDDGKHWLADGFHRLEAHRAAGRGEIPTDIREGTFRDAKLFAFGANDTHGLRRTQEDKRNAIMKMLTDPEWKSLSDREIARHTKTDHKTVGKMRRELSGESGGEIPTKAKGGEIPTPQSGGGEIPTSMMAKILAGLPDDVLLDEAKRRGLSL